MLLRSGIVYKFTWHCCGALYLGETRRYLHTQILEHMGVSPSTGKKLATTSLSSIQTNPHQTLHTVFPADFSIISSCRSYPNLELFIRESLLISELKPSHNKNISSIPLSLF